MYFIFKMKNNKKAHYFQNCDMIKKKKNSFKADFILQSER